MPTSVPNTVGVSARCALYTDGDALDTPRRPASAADDLGGLPQRASRLLLVGYLGGS